MRSLTLFSMALFSCFMCAGCDVDVKDEGKMPEVKVEEGEMPDVDVRGPDVDVKMEEEEVSVPDVDVEMKKEKVTVPDVDIDLPEENDNE